MIITISSTVGAGLALMATGIGIAAKQGSNEEKRLQKQRDLQREIAEKDYKAAAERFKELCELKEKIENEKFENEIERICQDHRDSIDMTAYMSSLGNWPLSIPPMVIRNDSLFIDDNLKSDFACKYEPVHILLSPCNESTIEPFWNDLQSQIGDLLSKWCTVETGHQALLYDNTWRVTTINNVTVQNIYSKTTDVPVIVLIPLLSQTDGSMFLQLYHWNILQATYTSNIISTGKKLDDTKDEFPNLIKGLIVRLIDEYAWNRYGLPPLLPSIISSEDVIYTEDEKKGLASDYAQSLENQMNRGVIIPSTDAVQIFDFCKNVDETLHNNKCFQKILDKTKTDNDSIASFGFDFDAKMIDYCQSEQAFYKISDDTLDDLKSTYVERFLNSKVYNKIQSSESKRPIISDSGLRKKFGELISKTSGISDFKKQCVEKMYAVLDSEHSQLDVRAKITKEITTLTEETIKEYCRNIENEALNIIKDEIDDYVGNVLWNNMNELKAYIKDPEKTENIVHPISSSFYPDKINWQYKSNELDATIDKFKCYVSENYTWFHFLFDDEIYKEPLYDKNHSERNKLIKNIFEKIKDCLWNSILNIEYPNI